MVLASEEDMCGKIIVTLCIEEAKMFLNVNASLVREALKNGESWESVPTCQTPPPSQVGNP